MKKELNIYKKNRRATEIARKMGMNQKEIVIDENER